MSRALAPWRGRRLDDARYPVGGDGGVSNGAATELPRNAAFGSELEKEHEIIPRTAGKMREIRIRVLAGDEVLVETKPYDLTQGRIPD